MEIREFVYSSELSGRKNVPLLLAMDGITFSVNLKEISSLERTLDSVSII
jgi:hypothetical protein